MKLILAICVAATAADFTETVNKVNSMQSSWTAAHPDRFASEQDVKVLLGAFLPGDAKHRAPAVDNTTLLSDFDLFLWRFC